MEVKSNYGIWTNPDAATPFARQPIDFRTKVSVAYPPPPSNEFRTDSSIYVGWRCFHGPISGRWNSGIAYS